MVEQNLLQAYPAGMPEEQVWRLGRDVAGALVQWEKQGIVHQAVKPQNVFVTEGGFRLGEPGRSNMPCGGDLSCMCPEMYWGEGFDSRADVYAVGLLLHTVLGGEKIADLRRLEGETLSRPNGSEKLVSIVMRACAYEPKERFASVEAMAKALERENG